MRFKVTAPTEDYSGKTGDVQFSQGSAVIDEQANPMELAYCRNAGYSVEPVQEEKPADPVPEPEPVPFDPSQHDIPTVLGHAEAADADEATRVFDAEAAGKNRKGVMDNRDAVMSRKESVQ